MIDYVQSWCLNALAKVRGRLVERKVKYQDAPEGARIPNNLSRRAEFNYATKRRRGYCVTVYAKDLLALLPDAALTDERRATLLDNWFRGIVWQPIMVVADPSKNVWVIDTVSSVDVVVFMAELDEIIKLQVMEAEDLPATQDKLKLLGMGLFDGWAEHCPVLTSQIVY